MVQGSWVEKVIYHDAHPLSGSNHQRIRWKSPERTANAGAVAALYVSTNVYCPINELIIKERDVYSTPSILVTHRLQDAFTMATHRFSKEDGKMVPLPAGQTNPLTSFLVLHQGKVLSEGSMEHVKTDPKVVEVYLGH